MTRAPLTVLAPLSGTVVPLTDVPDPVFAGAMVGPGLVLAPGTADGPVDVLSPVAGTVAALHAHAVVVEVDAGRAVLVHLGVDTVGLGGQGYVALVARDDVVPAGAPLLRWDPAAVAASGCSTLCPIVALVADPALIGFAVAPGDRVSAGDALLTWR